MHLFVRRFPGFALFVFLQGCMETKKLDWQKLMTVITLNKGREISIL
jgi:hypothetical protein